MSWIKDKAHGELARIREAKEKQVYPYFRPFESGGLHTSIAGQPIVNFSSNDYLGLTNHPKVKEAAKAAVEKLRVRPLELARAGHDRRARRARGAPRAWFKIPKCLVTTTGYQAMVGTIMSLADIDTTLVLDQLSHACILDGTLPRRGRAEERLRGPLLQPQLRALARARAQDARAQERARVPRGRLLARRRPGDDQGDPRGL
jgi:7-keto-8-aminopelargonate synthetase-like enzyme